MKRFSLDFSKRVQVFFWLTVISLLDMDEPHALCVLFCGSLSSDARIPKRSFVHFQMTVEDATAKTLMRLRRFS